MLPIQWGQAGERCLTCSVQLQRGSCRGEQQQAAGIEHEGVQRAARQHRLVPELLHAQLLLQAVQVAELRLPIHHHPDGLCAHPLRP